MQTSSQFQVGGRGVLFFVLGSGRSMSGLSGSGLGDLGVKESVLEAPYFGGFCFSTGACPPKQVHKKPRNVPPYGPQYPDLRHLPKSIIMVLNNIIGALHTLHSGTWDLSG